MGMDVTARYTVTAEDREEVMRGVGLLRRRTAADRVRLLVLRPDGSQELVGLSGIATTMIADLLEKAAGAEDVLFFAEVAEISPEEAATILGISRPLVRRRMDNGALPFRRVGAHRRIRLADVLTLKKREAPVRAAMKGLRADTHDLMARGL